MLFQTDMRLCCARRKVCGHRVEGHIRNISWMPATLRLTSQYVLSPLKVYFNTEYIPF